VEVEYLKSAAKVVGEKFESGPDVALEHLPAALDDGCPGVFASAVLVAGDGDEHFAPVSGVGDALGVAGVFEAVDGGGDGLGAEPCHPGEVAGREGACVLDDVEAAVIGTVEPWVLGGCDRPAYNRTKNRVTVQPA